MNILNKFKLKSKTRKTGWIYIIIIVFIIFIALVGYFYLKKPSVVNNPTSRQNICADNLLDVEYSKVDRTREDGLIEISVKNKETDERLSNFSLNDVYEGHYHFIEVRNCFIYLIKQFGFDYEKGVWAPDYRRELWRYNLSGVGEKIFPFIKGEQVQGIDFRVNQNETHVAIRRPAQDQSLKVPPDEMSFINLINKKEVYRFSVNDLIDNESVDKNLTFGGDIKLKNWTKDGRYFWGSFSAAANVLGFFRIDTTDWSIRVFEVPKGVGNGDALNMVKGYVTQHPDNPWVGIQEHKELIKKEFREQGIISMMYIYNLFTKESTLIATTTEPLWFFQPRWTSDTVLQYEFPDGEKKIYKLK